MISNEIDVQSFASARSDHVESSEIAVWIEGTSIVSMYRHVEYCGVVPKGSLGTVTVMHVPTLINPTALTVQGMGYNSPIKDQDFLGKTQPLHFPRSHSDVVEEAETHMLVGFSVVPGWTNDRKCVSYFAFAHGDRCCDRTSTCEFGTSR